MWKHCINTLIGNIFLFFIFGTPCGSWIRDQTSASLQWESRVLTIGPAENSETFFLVIQKVVVHIIIYFFSIQ